MALGDYRYILDSRPTGASRPSAGGPNVKKDEIRFKKYIVLLDMFLIVGGEGSSNRNASRDESVEAGDKSVEAGDESIEAGEKTPQSCYNHAHFLLQTAHEECTQMQHMAYVDMWIRWWY